ncbi:hypothetical protein ACWEHA_18145, partial [Amycolatopsis nivea]
MRATLTDSSRAGGGRARLRNPRHGGNPIALACTRRAHPGELVAGAPLTAIGVVSPGIVLPDRILL